MTNNKHSIGVEVGHFFSPGCECAKCRKERARLHEKLIGTGEFTLAKATALLRESSAHVARQQHAGKHAQDREDAKDLLPRIEAFLRGPAGEPEATT